MSPRETPPHPETGDEVTDGAATSFYELRPRLFGIAYRMLGSVADADDILQEAYLRWSAATCGEIRNPSAYLARVVTRLCLDHLKSARVRRECYVGPWLPEPLVAARESDGPENISLLLMLALERLSPLERAAFLLHDVFDLPFEEVTTTLGRDSAACRQLAARARKHVRAARPRFPLSQEQGYLIADAFFEASRTGDADALRRLLAEDVIAYTDGGGRAPAALNPILGRDRVVRMFLGLARKSAYRRPPLLRRGLINALPGFITIERGDVLQTTAVRTENDAITAIYIVRNPDKLRHLSRVGTEPGGVR